MEPRVLQHDRRGHGEPLVLIPGGLTGWLSWIPHQERLAANYDVIRVQPIHNELGSAGQPGDPSYTVETAIESLRLTLDALDLDAAHFAGWSAGGQSLLEFAMTWPERTRTLTFIEPASYWVLEETGEQHAELQTGNAFIQNLAGRAVSEDDLAHFFKIAGFTQPGENPRESPIWERSLPHRMTLSWLFTGVGQSNRSIDDLRRITCPVLLIKGAVSIEWEKRVVDTLGDLLANAKVIELEGDHACHLQSADRFLEELTRHIDSAQA
jgi:pimeloyl-ACP methyl ester carboxylesterase